MKQKNLIIFLIFLIIIGIAAVALAQTTFSEGNSFSSSLLTEPYLKFDAETDINAPLNLKESLNFISSSLKGELITAQLTQDRNYILPNLSGEICLSAGNCLISPQGSPNYLAKFTTQGLANSSIEDFSQDIAVFINSQGNVGIGINSPDYKLHVAGRIQAYDDICTDIQGGRCLSELSQISSAVQTTLQGEGITERIPLWRERLELGSSEIYQSGRNIGIGTTPAYKLDVAGTVRMLGFRLPISPREGYGLLSDERGFGSWKPVLTPLSMGADVAENFIVNPKCKALNNCPESGDLVSISENKFIEKSSLPYDPRLIGIISTNPALTLAGELDPLESQPVALVGQVPTKISLENGPIEIGDVLTSSIIQGIAKKAVKSGRIVGIALEAISEDDFKNCQNKDSNKVFDCEKKIGKIDVLINLHNHLQLNP